MNDLINIIGGAVAVSVLAIVIVVVLFAIYSILEVFVNWIKSLVAKRKEKRGEIEDLRRQVNGLTALVFDLARKVDERTLISNGDQYYHVNFRQADISVKDIVNRILAHLNLTIVHVPGRGPEYYLEPEISMQGVAPMKPEVALKPKKRGGK